MRGSFPRAPNTRSCALLSVLAALGVVLGVAGCESSVIAWSEPTVVPLVADAGLTVDARGRARFVEDRSAAVRPPEGANVCPSSFRAARQQDGTFAAVWWSVRSDSSAVLDAAVSPDAGVHWSGAVPVDTTDVSTAGCVRPPPAIAASLGFVHIAYSARGRDGAGVFYAHSMTQGKSYEPPIAMIYGERMTHAAVAADRGLVAVAYEDPNGLSPQIGLALSRSWGHTFDDRSRVSAGGGAATDPQVAVTEHAIAVSWIERARMDASDAPAARLVRVARVP